MKKTLYELLGITQSASPEEIKKAFRKLAIKYHPDTNPNKKETEELFRSISSAYKILSHGTSRFKYDATLKENAPSVKTTGTKKHAPSAATTSVGRNLAYHLNIALEDLFRDGKKTISYLRHFQGKRVSASVVVDIPIGTMNGQKLRLRGAGESLTSRQIPGDLIVHIHYAEHAFFRINGFDVLLDVPISLFQFLLKEPLAVPTLHGKKIIAIPTADEFGDIAVTLPGLGLPIKRGTNRYGDLFIKMKVQSPPEISDSLRTEIHKISKLLPKSREEFIFEEFFKKYEK